MRCSCLVPSKQITCPSKVSSIIACRTIRHCQAIKWDMFACRETTSQGRDRHRNDNFKKQKQQIHKKPGALRGKYGWKRWMTHQEGAHLFSIFRMENNSELRAAQSCHTCQKLHRWNVNDTDGELKMASNPRVQKGWWSKIPRGKVFSSNPPRCEWCSHQHHKQEATSTTSGYLLRQILSLCPPSSTTSTGWGLTGSAALSPLTAFARLSLQLHLCSWIYDFRLQQSSAAFCIFSVFLFFTSSVFGLFWGFFAAQKDF